MKNRFITYNEKPWAFLWFKTNKVFCCLGGSFLKMIDKQREYIFVIVVWVIHRRGFYACARLNIEVFVLWFWWTTIFCLLKLFRVKLNKIGFSWHILYRKYRKQTVDKKVFDLIDLWCTNVRIKKEECLSVTNLVRKIIFYLAQ